MTSAEILAKAKEKTNTVLNLKTISFNLAWKVSLISGILIYEGSKRIGEWTGKTFLRSEIETLKRITGLGENWLFGISFLIIGILVYFLNMKFDKRPLIKEQPCQQKAWIRKKIRHWNDKYEDAVYTLKIVRLVPESAGFYWSESVCLEKMDEHLKKIDAGKEALSMIDQKKDSPTETALA